MAEEVAVEQVPLDQIDDQAEYVKARQAGVETIEREKPAEAEIIEEPAAEEAKAEEEKPKGKGGGIQSRLDRLTKQAKEAQDRAEAAEKELANLRNGKPKEEPVKAKGEPKQEDYTDYERYLIDKAKWEIKEDSRVEREEGEKKTQNERVKAVFDAHIEREIAAKAKYEDYAEVTSVKMPWTGATQAERDAQSALQTALVEDDNSAELFYHLGKNPEELAKMANMTPAQIVKAVGRMSDKIGVLETEQETEEQEETEEKAEETPKRKPPTPIKPINSGSSRSSVPLSKMEDQRSYAAARRAGRIR